MTRNWTQPPQLLTQTDQKQYRAMYEGFYCDPKFRFFTSDGYRVRFYPEAFDDAFFESENRSLRDKSRFSIDRAQRMLWIKWALANPHAELYEGWDRDFRIPNPSRRAALLTGEFGSYVVIVFIGDEIKAKFITAYIPDYEGVRKIRSGKKWTLKNCR